MANQAANELDSVNQMDKVKFIVVIPARYGSTRFPGKPLALLKGKPMIQHVVERANEAGAEKVIVATDDSRIADVVTAFGAQVCMTRDDHESGTTRIAEVLAILNYPDDTIVVNVQGDEPFIPATNIRQVAQNLNDNASLPMATLAYPISDAEDIFNMNVVKVVTNSLKHAMYFSRAPIPFDRDIFASKAEKEMEIEHLASIYLRHIGIYGYRAGFVKQYESMPATQLEKTESLEQLRVLWHGHAIHVDVAKHAPPHGVDTPEDLAKLQ
ncbi:MAG: 3-deoxy-manno-octulosonate cytidylyltransferase (CMP-KDO synthetase) [Glaciecola sp.]|jgi:3-deoxy-manno-octulosonate cytidylyltransferase (CMP-KDO synthetase)